MRPLSEARHPQSSPISAEPPASTGGAGPPARILVWDQAVRTFHWLLVASVLAAWATGGSASRLHELAGYAVASLVVFRLLWGLTGTRRARFADFVTGPRALWRYIAALRSGAAERHLGHNPAGAAMIVALLGGLTVVVVTGLLQQTSAFFGVSWVETTHHYAANAVLALVPLHVLGVVISSLLHRENLVAAMLTGAKPADAAASHELPSANDDLAFKVHGSQGFTVLLLLLAGGLYAGWSSTAHRSETTISEVPPTPAVIEVTEAVRASAASQSKDVQDLVVGGPEDASQAWLLASGGRLYDNWFVALGKDGPKTTHPSWPSANTAVEGSATWRCKSCHGWDYLGREGQYRSGENATGIGGIRGARGRDPAEIMAVLSNATHRLTDDLIPRHAKYRLAAFVSSGQHTVSTYIPSGKGAKGDPQRGKAVFQTVCASCHGFDGRARRLGLSAHTGPDTPGLYVGTKATTNPAEVLHKIRNGHPGAIMISLRAFPMEVAANVLAYAQTLPRR